jgi:two-component system LytT family response regulator
MLKVLIIEDEFKGREYLKLMLQKYFSGDISEVEVASSYEEGIAAISRFSPNILFLDIEMPSKSGFDILEQFSKIDFEVIFTTAFNQYAIKAIKYGALDYLLKPIDPLELKNAFNKAKERLQQRTASGNITAVIQQLKNVYNKQIGLPTSTGVLFVDIDDVIRFEASSNYTFVYLENNKKELICRTLKDIEAVVLSFNFFRVHKSHLVNLGHIKEYIKSDGGYIIMIDGATVPVSKNQRNELSQKWSII